MQQSKENSLIPQNRIDEIAVEQVTFFNGMVSIDYCLPEWSMTKELTVDGDKYAKHLKDILALDWSFQVHEGNVYKDDVEGEMSTAEYFAGVDFQQKNKDAVSYLKANHVDHQGLPDVFGAIAAIVKPKFPNPTTYSTQRANQIAAAGDAYAAMYLSNEKDL